MTERSPSESWQEYRRLVLAALERYDREIDELKKEKGDLKGRLEQVERLSAVLRKAVFGDGTPDSKSMATQIALLQKFVRDHPSLVHEGADAGEKKLDKKMLVLLVGAISGLIGILKIAIELIAKLAG